MGNIVLKSVCQFSLDLEDDTSTLSNVIIAGNNLRGRVLVRVDQGTPKIPATEIVLRLAGKEKTKISRGKQTTVAERLFCSTRISLRREDEWSSWNIPPGTYVLPFSIALPSTLPSSMKARSYSDCAIVYKLKIDATPRGCPTIRGATQREFSVVSAPLPDVRVPASIAPHFITVNSLGGMVNRGMIGITARVIDVQVGRGDILDIFIATKNHASASIKRVQIDLIEEVVWKTKKYITESRTKILSTLSDVDLPGIMRGKQDKAAVREQVSRGVPRAELAFLHQELQSDRNLVRLRVPSHCRDSYSSSSGMICVTHGLKITTYTRDLISNPSVTIPLQIGTCPNRVTNSSVAELVPPQAEAELILAEAELIEGRVQLSPDAPTSTAGEAMFVPAPTSFQSSMAGEVPRTHNLPPSDITSIPVAEAISIPVGADAIQYPEATAPPEAMVVGGMAPYEYTFTASNAEDEAQLEHNNSSRSVDPLGIASSRSVDPPGIALYECTFTNSNSEDDVQLECNNDSRSSDDPFVPDNATSMRQSLGSSLIRENTSVAPTPGVDVLLQEMLYSVNDYEIIRTKLQYSAEGDSVWKSVFAAITPEEFGSIISHVNRDTDQPSVAVLLATEAIEQGDFTCDYGREAVLSSAEWNRQAMITLILPHCVDARENCGKIRDVLSEWDKIITQEVFNYYTNEM